MTVKEIILLAANEVGCGEKVQAYLAGGTDGEAETLALLRCFNLVENELALDYLPLTAEEEVASDTGAIAFSALSKPAVRVVKVTDEWGNEAPFKLYPDKLKTLPGAVKIEYTYTPTEKDLNGVPDDTRRTSIRLFAFGVAAEYCLATGAYEESAVWDKKYKEAIEATYRCLKARKIQSRRWA